MNYFDSEWYPMVLVGRTGNEVPKETVDAESVITKEVDGESPINKESDANSTVVP